MKDVFGQTLGQDADASRFGPAISRRARGRRRDQRRSRRRAGRRSNFYATNLPGDRYQAGYGARRGSPAAGIRRNSIRSTVLPALGASGPRARWRRRDRNAQSVVRRADADAARRARTARSPTVFDARSTRTARPSSTGIVQLTNLGVFAQWFPQRGMVLVAASERRRSRPRARRGNASTAYVGGPGDRGGALRERHDRRDGELDLRGVDIERC